MAHFYSTSDLAELLGTQTWRVRRLFESGTLPEPPRFAGKRAIPRDSIPDIVDALRERGWLPQKSSRAPAGAADDPSPRQGDGSHAS